MLAVIYIYFIGVYNRRENLGQFGYVLKLHKTQVKPNYTLRLNTIYLFKLFQQPNFILRNNQTEIKLTKVNSEQKTCY